MRREHSTEAFAEGSADHPGVLDEEHEAQDGVPGERPGNAQTERDELERPDRQQESEGQKREAAQDDGKSEDDVGRGHRR